MDSQQVLEGSHIIDDEESSNYEEPRERHPKVQYKLKICKNPAAKNMPHEEEYDDNNYESTDENCYIDNLLHKILMAFYVLNVVIVNLL